MAEEDTALFAVKNAFYLGAYASCIDEAADMEGLSDSKQIEKDCYVYRSHIALGHAEAVLQGIQDDAPTALLAIRLFGQHEFVPDMKDQVVAEMRSWLEDDACRHNSMVQTIAGLIFMREGEWTEALKACHKGATMEQHAICVQAYLGMERLDKAQEQVAAMEAIDEESILTQLCQGWVALELGGRKVQEAAFIFQEVGDRYIWTAQLQTWRAVAKMRMNLYEEAEEFLKEALALDPNHADALANSIICALHLGRPTGPLVQQLGQTNPNHVLLKRVRGVEESFKKAASAFA